MPMVYQLPLRLTEEDAKFLAAVARQTGRKKADVLRAALRHFYSMGADRWRYLAADFLLPSDGEESAAASGTKGGE